MAALLWLFSKTGVPSVNLWPWPAELLILSAAVPTAVNTLLITMEVGGDAELAADCVFWSTARALMSTGPELGSSITLNDLEGVIWISPLAV